MQNLLSGVWGLLHELEFLHKGPVLTQPSPVFVPYISFLLFLCFQPLG
jgi:hypothetical protein